MRHVIMSHNAILEVNDWSLLAIILISSVVDLKQNIFILYNIVFKNFNHYDEIIF